MIGVICTEEILSVPSLQALDCHREVEICGGWRSVGGSGLSVAVYTARIGAHVAQISKQVWPEVTSALKSSEVGCSPLVPEFVSPAPVVLLFTDDFGDYGVFVSDRTGFAVTAEDVAYVAGLFARYVHIDGFTQGALNVDSQVKQGQQ